MISLRVTGPPVPTVARMHSTPQRPFKRGAGECRAHATRLSVCNNDVTNLLICGLYPAADRASGKGLRLAFSLLRFASLWACVTRPSVGRVVRRMEAAYNKGPTLKKRHPQKLCRWGECCA
eukprot:1185346-Prorocentrum_minimum.AAC.1